MADDTPAEQMVPLSRLNSAIAARKELEAKVSELKQQIKDLGDRPSADTVAELTASLEAERKARKDDAARFTARESFVRIGMDPDEDADAMEVIRGRYEKLPAKDRPSLHEWLTGGAKEDKLASRLLPQAEATPETPAAETPAAAPETPATPRPTGTNAGTAPTPPAGKPMSRREYEAALKSAGTKEEVKAVMKEYGL